MSSNNTDKILRDHPELELDPTMPIRWYRPRDQSTSDPAFSACDSTLRQSALTFDRMAGDQQEVKDLLAKIIQAKRDDGGRGQESIRLQKQLAGAMETMLKIQQAVLEENIKIQAALQKLGRESAKPGSSTASPAPAEVKKLKKSSDS
ncbi:hypothetical protein KJ359_007389 [Pestalotiopsis sp. 9143b]|nr:hypothetical protein KJ359_007389 [Pestalotiopsis sp. 9143b]